MKVSKFSWIFIVIALLVIAGIYLGLRMSQQSIQEQQLETSLDQAKQKLSQATLDGQNKQKEQLNLTIQQNTDEMKSAEELLSYSGDSIQATNQLLEDAARYSIEITNITSPGLAEEILVNADCETLSISITAQGELNNLRDFIISLSTIFPTGMVSSAQINRPAPQLQIDDTDSSTSPAAPVELEGYNANIQLTIYNYEGSSHVE